MSDTVATLVAEVQGVVDVTPTEALSALNRRHRRMVARGRSLRKRLEVGPTVAGQARYDVAGVVEVLRVSVGGVPYGKARGADIYGASLGQVAWSGAGGLVVADASTAGVQGLTLIPTPTEAGLSVELFVAAVPPDLLTSDVPLVDPDYFDVLVDAAAATFLRRIGEGDPEGIEARFEGACEEFRGRVNRRFRGAGPAQIRVQGLNA